MRLFRIRSQLIFHIPAAKRARLPPAAANPAKRGLASEARRRARNVRNFHFWIYHGMDGN
jgi:hypothetical protein